MLKTEESVSLGKFVNNYWAQVTFADFAATTSKLSLNWKIVYFWDVTLCFLSKYIRFSLYGVER
jgi:hypothetical protein